MEEIRFSPGIPFPLGASQKGKGFNFALYSTKDEVELALFDPGSRYPFKEFPLFLSGNVWHLHVENLPKEFYYCFKVKKNFVQDPYAKKLITPHQWGKKEPLILAQIPSASPFDWQGDQRPNLPFETLIVYEMHVRGFTQDPSSGVSHPGTFLGMIEKIPYLKELGINAVELLPIFEFEETLHPKKGLYNYWGYSTLNFFCPMNRYAISDAKDEFRTLVKALHQAGIEVILDVVFNHVGDRNSLYQTAPSTYFILDKKGRHTNYTGCGNTVNCNDPIVIHWIISSLRYWVEEMHVDGFRFDLASIFYRGKFGKFLNHPPLIDAINHDPLLSKVKLIAEPWDCGGLYQLGKFPPKWAEWNGQYRDTVRRFLKGTDGQVESFATVLSGSFDLFKKKKWPHTSINFVTAHDGFTLCDLVSYNHKHNEENKERNQDGNDWNESWNCGVEGPTDNEEILHLREKQIRNFLTALCFSFGTPMFLMGDEYGHSRKGNNNGYCQDNEKNYFLWSVIEENPPLLQFFKQIIQLRKVYFHKHLKIQWHDVDWAFERRRIAFKIGNLFVAFNAHFEWAPLQLPDEVTWKRIVDTNLLHFDETEVKLSGEYHLAPYSSLILLAE